MDLENNLFLNKLLDLQDVLYVLVKAQSIYSYLITKLWSKKLITSFKVENGFI